MAIPASYIVDIQPRVVSGGSNDLEMNGLILTANETISTGTMVLSFSGAEAVSAYFGPDSAEYAAAKTYFTGYVNKFSAPKAFMVARRVAEPVAGWVRGARYAGTLARLKAVKNGSLVLTVDGTAVSVDGLDLSGASSLSAVASVIQTALASESSGTTVGYSTVNGAFTVTSGSRGASSSVSAAETSASGTDLGVLLGLTAKAGAIVSPGSDGLTVAGQMAAVRARTENWVTFTTLHEAEAEEILEWAAWAGENYGWLYVAHTADPNTPNPDAATDPASLLKAAGHDHTAIVYGTVEYALFVMGTIASISWLRTNGTITLAFKRQDGLAAYVTGEAEAQALEDKNCNYFGNFATRNAEFVFLYNGCLSSSDYGFIDPYINSVWLNNRLQAAIMDGITLAGRVPYNDRGYTMIRAWMTDPVNEARLNGAIEPGVELSESQRSQLMNEAGLDIAQDLWTRGYYIQISDPGTSARARRETPLVSLWYTYGGAVQKIGVASTAVQ